MDALSFVAWCLSVTQERARAAPNDRLRVAFDCPVALQGALLEAFVARYMNVEHRVYLNPAVDRVTLELTWSRV